MAVISKGITLSYKTEQAFVALTNLQDIPDLGGEVESIEITTLSDEAHKYTDGIKNYGESISFTFLYDKTQFSALNALESCDWKVVLPDNTNCVFTGKGSVKLNGVGVNEALTYTLSIKPSSGMTWGTESLPELSA